MSLSLIGSHRTQKEALALCCILFLALFTAPYAQFLLNQPHTHQHNIMAMHLDPHPFQQHPFQVMNMHPHPNNHFMVMQHFPLHNNLMITPNFMVMHAANPSHHPHPMNTMQFFPPGFFSGFVPNNGPTGAPPGVNNIAPTTTTPTTSAVPNNANNANTNNAFTNLFNNILNDPQVLNAVDSLGNSLSGNTPTTTNPNGTPASNPLTSLTNALRTSLANNANATNTNSNPNNLSPGTGAHIEIPTVNNNLNRPNNITISHPQSGDNIAVGGAPLILTSTTPHIETREPVRTEHGEITMIDGAPIVTNHPNMVQPLTPEQLAASFGNDAELNHIDLHPTNNVRSSANQGNDNISNLRNLAAALTRSLNENAAANNNNNINHNTGSTTTIPLSINPTPNNNNNEGIGLRLLNAVGNIVDPPAPTSTTPQQPLHAPLPPTSGGDLNIANARNIIQNNIQ